MRGMCGSEHSELDPWLGPPDSIAARIVAYQKIGVTTVIASLPAPYDEETIHRLREEVEPSLGVCVSNRNRAPQPPLKPMNRVDDRDVDTLENSSAPRVGTTSSPTLTDPAS
jgi:hypothetical protein